MGNPVGRGPAAETDWDADRDSDFGRLQISMTWSLLFSVASSSSLNQIHEMAFPLSAGYLVSAVYAEAEAEAEAEARELGSRQSS